MIVSSGLATDRLAARPQLDAALRDFHSRGFAVVKGVFAADEVARVAAAFDRLYAQGLRHRRSYRHGNLFFRIAEDARLGRIVRYLQWPSYVDPVLDAIRLDPRMLAIVRPLIGPDVKQIINQLHWKPPGAAAVEFGYHQDIRFRRPRSAYRNPAESYVQTGLAIDPHRIDNGAMVLYPGSHRLGELALGNGRVMETPLRPDDLIAVGLDPGAAVTLDLDPGDVALWHLYTVHGSGANHSAIDRRLYISGYVRADSCDRGAWTFRDGRPVPLGAPVLIHYEDLHVRPDPHYVDD
ncbi:MAG: phytanoyl-CoA dioxygenase family protein [Rhodospirillales bacterium]